MTAMMKPTLDMRTLAGDNWRPLSASSNRLTLVGAPTAPARCDMLEKLEAGMPPFARGADLDEPLRVPATLRGAA